MSTKSGNTEEVEKWILAYAHWQQQEYAAKSRSYHLSLSPLDKILHGYPVAEALYKEMLTKQDPDAFTKEPTD